MIKKFFTYFLILQLTIYVLSSSVIWVTYYIFKDYIVEKYCENKETPMCGGKCHMMKVEKESPKDKDIPKIEVRTPEVFPFIVLDFSSYSKNIDEKFTSFIIKDEGKSNDFSREILKPPEINFFLKD